MKPTMSVKRIVTCLRSASTRLSKTLRGVNLAQSNRPQTVSAMSSFGVRREKAALSSGCKSHPATAPAGSNRSSYGGNEVAEAFG